MSCNAGLVEMYSFSLLLSGKLLILPSILNESLAGYSCLGCRPLLFITWNISCHFLLVYSVSIQKSAASLIRAPLCYFLFDYSQQPNSGNSPSMHQYMSGTFMQWNTICLCKRRNSNPLQKHGWIWGVLCLVK